MVKPIRPQGTGRTDRGAVAPRVPDLRQSRDGSMVWGCFAFHLATRASTCHGQKVALTPRSSTSRCCCSATPAGWCRAGNMVVAVWGRDIPPMSRTIDHPHLARTGTSWGSGPTTAYASSRCTRMATGWNCLATRLRRGRRQRGRRMPTPHRHPRKRQSERAPHDLKLHRLYPNGYNHGRGLQVAVLGGSARKDFKAFPLSVQKDLGVALFIVQAGGLPDSAKRWKGLGSGVYELMDDYRGDAFRVVYTVRVGDAVHVLHAFRKNPNPGLPRRSRMWNG